MRKLCERLTRLDKLMWISSLTLSLSPNLHQILFLCVYCHLLSLSYSLTLYYAAASPLLAFLRDFRPSPTPDPLQTHSIPHSIPQSPSTPPLFQMLSQITKTKTLSDQLCDTTSPSFLFGSTPPRDGTDKDKAEESCVKFTHRSAVLATDGFIVYDIQDEKGRTTMERPFPFRKTLDPSWYGSLFPKHSAKQTVIYKCIIEHSIEAFEEWVNNAIKVHNHNSFVLVGAPTSTTKAATTMKEAAMVINKQGPDISFGCVAIAERHTKKNNEQFNMMRKQNYGAKYFITQGIFNSVAIIRLLKDYGTLCRELDVEVSAESKQLNGPAERARRDTLRKSRCF